MNPGLPDGDVDGSGGVTLADFSYISTQWLSDGLTTPSADIWPDCGDRMVDMEDLMLMIHHFLESH
jgi:hypothetical protein